MKKILILLLAIELVSCQKNNLKSQFTCTSSSEFGKTKEFRDIMKKFKVAIPANWKTQLYYDETKSQIYSADTTKQLTETYIYDVTWHQGELELNDSFAQKVKDTLAIKEQLNTVKSGFSEFKDKPIYWNLASGISSNFPYQILQVYVKSDLDEYITFTTKVYGSDQVDERFCESIELFDEMVIIE
tara:strand:- start:191491 stop:192048 length:558 start_codon:yes stop_codon:yes gene_type:complete